jgi:CRISPR-associated protein Csh2
LHHFSVNPQNLQDVLKLAGEGASSLSSDDISKLKDALRNSVTYYDSAAKAGTDNEFLLWVQLKSGSKKVLPNFTQLINLDKADEKIVLDLAKVRSITDANADDIESIEIYYQKECLVVQNAPANAKHLDITSGK